MYFVGAFKPGTLFYIIVKNGIIHYICSVIKNKRIILSVLFLAWTIIFAHSVVPHHHHVEKFYLDKGHSHGHHQDHCHDNDLCNEQIHECNHDCHDHACHFHVEVLTQISIDKIFIANIENTFFSYSPLKEKSDYTCNTEIVFDQLPKTDHLRGPPVIT